MASTSCFPINPSRLKVIGLIAGLLLLAGITVGFTVMTVQIVAGAGAYINGQSLWSRAQLASVHHLDLYAAQGKAESLEKARDWLDIPKADRQARLYLEQEKPDYRAAKAHLVEGGNHPADAARMIWLYRHFSGIRHLQRALDVWRQSDPYILALDKMADVLEAEWRDPDPKRLETIRAQLVAVNNQLDPLTAEFRRAMSEATRWITSLLSVITIGLLVIIALLAWWMSWCLLRIIRRSEGHFRAIFEQAAVGMAQVSLGGRILDVNTALCETLDHAKPTLLTLRYRDLVPEKDWPEARQEVERIASGGHENHVLERRLKTGNGSLVWVRLTVSLAQTGGKPYHVVIVEDISESKRLSVELSHQATHDALTGLFNRRAFDRRLSESLTRARAEQAQHAVCFIDLDRFKLTNDTAGHYAGDTLLRQVVDVIRTALPGGEMLARLGSDEFGLILENCDLETAADVADYIRNEVNRASFVWRDRRFHISCSIGLVPLTSATPSVDSALRAADIACHIAKRKGRNRLYVSQENDQNLAEHRGQMEWLNRIREALRDDRFFLDAQLISPIGEPAGLRYEVLVRLRDEAGQVVSPGTFLPVAERFGIVHQIDRWVIEKVFQQLAQHPQHLKNLEACHINLSGRSFDQPDFEGFVINLLEKHLVPPEKICFEITETAAVDNLVDAMSFMENLGARGCTFALDDFGTGLSSFSYLRQFPVDYLKIDGVFVRDITRDETDLAMVRAINSIGQALHKHTIAEFVEDDATGDLLRSLGVGYLQGFGIHRPSRFEALVAEEGTGLSDG